MQWTKLMKQLGISCYETGTGPVLENSPWKCIAVCNLLQGCLRARRRIRNFNHGYWLWTADLDLLSRWEGTWYFRGSVAVFDHTIRGGRALGLATQTHSRIQIQRAALGSPQNMKKYWPNLFRKEGQGCKGAKKAKPTRPICSIFRIDCCLLTMFWLTGGYARWVMS